MASSYCCRYRADCLRKRDLALNSIIRWTAEPEHEQRTSTNGNKTHHRIPEMRE